MVGGTFTLKNQGYDLAVQEARADVAIAQAAVQSARQQLQADQTLLTKEQQVKALGAK